MRSRTRATVLGFVDPIGLVPIGEAAGEQWPKSSAPVTPPGSPRLVKEPVVANPGAAPVTPSPSAKAEGVGLLARYMLFTSVLTDWDKPSGVETRRLLCMRS
jgi:hypothetical protein